MFMPELPKETEADRQKPQIQKGDKRALWVIPDSRGRCKGLLHAIRSSGYAKDIIVLVSKKTQKSYLKYLADRQYDYHIIGSDHVDYRKALQLLTNKYKAKTIVTDTGGTLSNILLDMKLIDEISLLIAPILVGTVKKTIFQRLKSKSGLRIKRCEKAGKNLIHLVYKVKL
jgi:2,5-diamino-6-(ribosylamino)-4(3H)-pyrimidinone 5'-phosphate reductase